ncbi:MAG: PKD domain-containing protein [Nanopusillaceae archaeon]
MAGENVIGFRLNLTQSSLPGDYAVELSLVKDDYTLSYGVKYIPVEGSVINSIRTDRNSYKQNETAVLTVVLYSNVQFILKIKSGSKLIAESIIENLGLVTKNYTIPIKEMSTNVIEASLTTPYSVSSKLVTFGIINLPPKAVAGTDKTVEVNTKVTFDGTSSYDPGDDPLTYIWDFGDGKSASGPIVIHTYDSVGVYIVRLTVKDSKGAYDIATLKVNVVDTTPPEIFSIYPLNGSSISTSTPVISASFSDNVAVDTSKVFISLDDVDITLASNITPSGFSYTPSAPLTGGLHKVHVSIVDLHGNRANLTWFFTTPVSISPPPLPPLPPPEPSPVVTTSLIVSIVANVPTKVEVSSHVPKSSLDYIEVISNISLPSVRFSVEEYSQNPTAYSPPSNVIPLSFLKIEIDTPSGSIFQAKIRFKLPITVIVNQNLDPESIQLYRLTTTWIPLITSMVGQDSEYYYYEALSPGFSYFAIAGIPTLRESIPPTILSIYPEDGEIITTKRPTIVIKYSDNVAVDVNTIRLLFDNVDATSLASINTTTLVFVPPYDLHEGIHSIYFEIMDRSGNRASKSVSFIIIDVVPPVIHSLQPLDGSSIEITNVTISASFYDNIAINLSSVMLMLDGVDVTSKSLITSNSISYVTTLEEDSHTVLLLVKDTSDNQATASWSFHHKTTS